MLGYNKQITVRENLTYDRFRSKIQDLNFLWKLGTAYFLQSFLSCKTPMSRHFYFQNVDNIKAPIPSHQPTGVTKVSLGLGVQLRGEARTWCVQGPGLTQQKEKIKVPYNMHDCQASF